MLRIIFKVTLNTIYKDIDFNEIFLKKNLEFKLS